MLHLQESLSVSLEDEQAHRNLSHRSLPRTPRPWRLSNYEALDACSVARSVARTTPFEMMLMVVTA